jgi:putative Ca2+/H+ antiporter (TMEM165/GDT1 family)
MEAFMISTASIAVGELGDKTQLLSLILATRFRKSLPIIAGIFAATLLNHLGACWVGEWAGKLISPQVLRWVLGISFLAVVAGTTLGMMIVNIPTVLFAERATQWVPVKVVRVVAAGI